MGIKRIKLGKTETIIAVVPKVAGGPGWVNHPTWVYISDAATGAVRAECIQPDERTAAMHEIWGIGAMVCAKLMEAVPVHIVRVEG